MQVQSLSRREAVARMQAAEARLLGENQPQQAAQLVASRKVLDSARGDTLWDTYSRAADRGKRCERIQQALLPPVYRGSRDHPSRTPGLIMAGAATVATGAVWYLRTGQPLYSLAASMLVGLAAFPLVDATAASIEDSRQVDTRRVGMAGLLTASLAGAASGGWAAPVAASVVTCGALTATAHLTAKAARRHQHVRNVINHYGDLFESSPPPAQLLGSAISKNQVVNTLARLESTAIAEKRFDQALEIRDHRKTVAGLEGENFHELFVAAQSRGGDQAQLLQRYADEILDDARQRADIQALITANPSATQLLIEEDTIEVGGQRLPVVHG